MGLLVQKYLRGVGIKSRICSSGLDALEEKKASRPRHTETIEGFGNALRAGFLAAPARGGETQGEVPLFHVHCPL